MGEVRNHFGNSLKTCYYYDKCQGPIGRISALVAFLYFLLSGIRNQTYFSFKRSAAV